MSDSRHPPLRDMTNLSPDYYQQMMRHLPEGVFEADVDMVICYANERIKQMFGYSEQDMRNGISAEQLVVSEDRARASSNISLRQQGVDVGAIEYTALCKDGTSFPALMNIAPYMESGELQGFRGLVMDISRQREAESARRVHEKKFSAAFSQAPYPLIIFRLTGGRIAEEVETVEAVEVVEVIEVNDAFCKMTGYTRQQAKRLNAKDIQAWDSEQERKRMIELITRDRELREHQLKFRAKSGAQLDVLVSATLIEMDDASHILATAKDITAQLKLEAQFQQAQKMESIGRLAGGVAHDFNNLLIVIRSYASMLMADAADPAVLQQDAEEISVAAKRATALTRQLLAFSRKQMMEPRVLNLSQVIGDVRKLIVRLIGEDIDCVFHLENAVGNIHADQAQVEQVVMNLLVNARDAMPHGGSVSIETFSRSLEVSDGLNVEGVFTALSISDTGEGMSEEVMAQMFEPFFTTREKGQGTGLGMSTVFGIVKQSGGTLTVNSTLGKGTTVTVYFPVVEGVVTRTDPPLPIAEVRGTETILLVEDERAVRDLIRRTLKNAGYQVISSSNGPEALFEFERQGYHIDLLLCDVVMPKMNGKELADRLLTMNNELHILFMSGYTDDIISLNGLQNDNIDLIQKPFEPPTLLARLRSVLDG